MNKIDGRKISDNIIAELKNLPKPKKFMAVFIFGDDKRSFGFVNKKGEAARELGVDFRIYNLPMEINNDVARHEILKVAKHKTCGGVLVQLPVPKHINRHYVMNVIPREKDVDVLGERALGSFYVGRNPVLPPAVGALSEIIKNLELEIKNYRVAIVGPGFLIGKPIATWLMGKVKEIEVLYRGSDFEFLRSADIVISGVGKPGIIKPDMLKSDALVIDFGYGEVGGETKGDFDDSQVSTENHQPKITYTPTPGGTGPILVAKLFENFYELN